MMKCFNNENSSAGTRSLAAICVRRNGVDSMYYVHLDRLGSYTHITDSSKQVIRALHFDPWGNVKNDANWLAFDSTTLSGNLAGTFRFFRGFTGHEHYAYLNIINMKAPGKREQKQACLIFVEHEVLRDEVSTYGRLYDPVIARFFSPDNFVQAPGFTQSYNRYSYCLNNPFVPAGQGGCGMSPSYRALAPNGAGLPSGIEGHHSDVPHLTQLLTTHCSLLTRISPPATARTRCTPTTP